MPGQNFSPKDGEAVGEVAALLLEQSQTVAVALMMLGGSIGTVSFFRRVEYLEREDRKPVDHKAGCFGVQRRGRRLRGRGFEQCYVDTFDEVVALLVQAVDGMLDFDHGSATSQRRARFVFAMPEIEVCLMLLENQLIERGGRGLQGCGGLVPVRCGPIVKPRNVRGVEHERASCHRTWCWAAGEGRGYTREMGAEGSQGVKKVERVLVYRLGSLGDHVVALPSYHLLARAFPEAERRMLTNYPVSVKAPAAAAVLGTSGLIHNYMRYEVGTRSVKELARLWSAIVRWRPDAVIYLAASRGEKMIRRDAWFFRMCGVTRIIGLPVTEELREPQWRDADGGGYEYESARLARRLSELGDARLDDRASWDLQLTEEERLIARDALGELAGKPFFAVSVGTKVQSKDWGRENWRALLGRMAEQYPGYGLALAGAPEESEASEFAADGWRATGGGPVVNLCGKLTPRQSAAAFAEATLFVGHDSGPMHLAATVGTRCVAIFAARNRPKEWFPYGTGHRVLFHKVSCWNCGLETCIVEKKRCITSISVDEVLTEVGHVVRDDAPPQTWYQIRETVR